MKRQGPSCPATGFPALDTEITLPLAPIDRLDIVSDCDGRRLLHRGKYLRERFYGRSFTYAFTAFRPRGDGRCTATEETGVSERNHFFEGVT